MNGVHDMGGMHGFGPVDREADEPVFHAEWERRAFALTLAMGAWKRWNTDMARFSRERMPPVDYLKASYYERWLWGLRTLLVEQGLVTPDEMARGTTGARAALRPEALTAPGVPAMLENRRAARLDDAVRPKFKSGDAVRARNLNPTGHTRLPRYLRGREGVIDRDHGVFIFPDSHAAGRGTKPQHVYSVRFAASELWGPGSRQNDAVYADLWDDYLEPA